MTYLSLCPTVHNAIPARLKQYIVTVVAKIFRLARPELRRHLVWLPPIGKLAEVHDLNGQPWRKGVPPLSGSVLDWPAFPSMAKPHLCDAKKVTPAQVQFTRCKDWSGQHVALMAHWDAQGFVAPYVLYYGRALKAQGYAVILCSDKAVWQGENSIWQARDCFDAVVYRTCTGYDFSSWKAALLAFPSLFQASTLLLTNDSIFGPVGQLKPLFSTMEQTDCDFWGLVESHQVFPHLQSYFIVFRKRTVAHPAFQAFWEYVTTSPVKRISIGYEVMLGPWLFQHGLRPAARFPASAFRFISRSFNPAIFAWDSLLQSGHFPFIKRELLFTNPYGLPLEGAEDLIASMGYDTVSLRYPEKLRPASGQNKKCQ